MRGGQCPTRSVREQSRAIGAFREHLQRKHGPNMVPPAGLADGHATEIRSFGIRGSPPFCHGDRDAVFSRARGHSQGPEIGVETAWTRRCSARADPLTRIHRQLTFAKPVLNRLPSTVSGIQAPPKIALIEGDRASQALLKHVFERDGFEILDTITVWVPPNLVFGSSGRQLS